MTTGEAAPTPWARRLGDGGLIPFVGLAAALWMSPPSAASLASLALLGYGATIVSFLGAVHWGLAMREGSSASTASLLWGVTPCLLGWAALMVGGAAGLLSMAVLLWACFAADRILYPDFGLRAWLPLRLRLTLVASLGCLAGAAALAQR